MAADDWVNHCANRGLPITLTKLFAGAALPPH